MSTKTLWIRLDVEGRALKADVANANVSTVEGRHYCWRGTDADLVELIYALKGINRIEVDGRPADVKELADMFGSMLGKVLPNLYHTHMTNQRRKKDKTPFLNSLIRVMLKGEDNSEPSS